MTAARLAAAAVLAAGIAVGPGGPSRATATATPATLQVSVDRHGGVATPGDSVSPAISDDGRWVAFESSSSNLVARDGNGVADVFVRDLVRGRTVRVNVDVDGGDADAGAAAPGAAPSVSADGRFVAFASLATDLVAGRPTEQVQDIFVRDLRTGTTTRVTVGRDGRAPNGDSHLPSISDDGRVVAFVSYAGNLVRGDRNEAPDVFVADLDAGTIVRAHVDADGGDPDAGVVISPWSASERPDLSGDGRSVAFTSAAADLVPADGNGVPDVFVRDLAAGTTSRASLDAWGGDPEFWSGIPTIDDDGTRVAYMTSSRDVSTLPNTGTTGSNVYVHDLATGVTTQVSVLGYEEQYTPREDSGPPSISGDGRWVAFETWVPFRYPDQWYGDRSSDLYLADLETGDLQLLTYDSTGNGTGKGTLGEVSDDGGVVVFSSAAYWMTEPEEDDGEDHDVYVRFTR